MKKSFTLCLMAALLLGMGTSCSKRSNSRVKEIVEKENALKAMAEEEKNALKVKQADEELKIAEQKRRDAAVPVEKLLRSSEDERKTSLSLYQLVLASKINGTKSDLVSIYEFTDADHDFKKELAEVEALTGITTESICNEITKKKLLQNDSDLVSIDRDIVHQNVDSSVSCRGLSLESNFLDKASLVKMCDSFVKKEEVKTEKKDDAKVEVKTETPVSTSAEKETKQIEEQK